MGVCCDVMGDPELRPQTSIWNTNRPTSSGKPRSLASWRWSVRLPAAASSAAVHEGHLWPYVRMLATPRVWKAQLQGDPSVPAEEEPWVCTGHVICGISVLWGRSWWRIVGPAGAVWRTKHGMTKLVTYLGWLKMSIKYRVQWTIYIKFRLETYFMSLGNIVSFKNPETWQNNVKPAEFIILRWFHKGSL